MQRLSNFADCHKCVGSNLFDLQRLFLVSAHLPKESVEHWQGYLRWLAFSGLQDFDYFGGFLAIVHEAHLPIFRVLCLPRPARQRQLQFTIAVKAVYLLKCQDRLT